MRIVLGLLLLASIFGFSASNWVEQKKWKAYFDKDEVKGTFLLYDLKNDKYLVYNEKRAKKGYLPASTFKIFNTLVGLETGVVDTNVMIRWDGVRRWNADWNRDMKLKTAFQLSCVPCYQQIARKVGAERMQEWVKKANYGKMDVQASNIDTFWLTGASEISAFEQVEFLKRIYKNDLPFSENTVAQLKNIMIAERKEDYVLRAKTGWTTQGKQNIGWYVGYVEKSDNVYFFALNIQNKIRKRGSGNFGPARKGITDKILKELKIL
ncbi:MAG: class D beta-lactamase [Saprospiraceae bacterium]